MARIPVGKVISTHGLEGEVQFKYYNEVVDDFVHYDSVIADKEGRETTLFPENVRSQKRILCIKFKGLDTVQEVSFLLNQELYVPEENLPPNKENEYYEYQLIGLDVLNEEGDKLGVVEGIIHTGAHDVLTVSGKQGLLVPMVEDFIVTIDVGKNCVQVREKLLLV